MSSSSGGGWDIAGGQSIGAPATNQWVHKAVVRSGTVFYAFSNGVLQSSWTSSLAPWNPSASLSIGMGQSTNYFIGYMDEVRITLAARYTANFAVPTSPF